MVGWEGYYEVSDHGVVRSVDRAVHTSNGRVHRYRGKVLAVQPRESGHLTVQLHGGGRHATRLVHHLVLEAFVGPRPPGQWGCHDNDVPSDNRRSNLRWDTPRSNVLDTVRNGRNVNAAKTTCPSGHLLQDPNLVASLARQGRRGCLACARARACRQQAHRVGKPYDFEHEVEVHYRKIMGLT